ncbi:MAG: type 1 glutamine amidotransferase [Alphaproteobacteria bacterium]|nr:type 1 glutamine amidotransferase [Alphaproteobacteria bacterium]MBU1526298.1 type 1 glutamine amidotransferase [Alphaproteobacteria bacterium]MBU2116102.1 type 1 glutamine amidotransferase [Alphaproteobacteria bacterium]MBU2351455.1 type 1 glutamine amidotransferase [Alphaproteobacteria bacterium]MBU2382790.1 type 1 glutamine amidotransferase [Alphaproteobacteria bacterium]
MTRTAILKTGAPPPALAERHGDYPAMFGAVLGEGLTTFDVQAGELPDPAAFDGAVITGSSAGVYEDHAWLPPLFDWIRAARGQTRLVGICFGHQAMAQALGGDVRKSDRGWGVGLHRYEVMSAEPWMVPPLRRVAVPASHQDQVQTLPPGARVTLASAFSPFGGLAWDDDAISMQFHPEFTPAYAADLAEGRRGRIEPAVVDDALKTLTGPNDRDVVGGWLRTFLRIG